MLLNASETQSNQSKFVIHEIHVFYSLCLSIFHQQNSKKRDKLQDVTSFSEFQQHRRRGRLLPVPLSLCHCSRHRDELFQVVSKGRESVRKRIRRMGLVRGHPSWSPRAKWIMQSLSGIINNNGSVFAGPQALVTLESGQLGMKEGGNFPWPSAVSAGQSSSGGKFPNDERTERAEKFFRSFSSFLLQVII